MPLGGYVKITGMNPEELDGLDPEVARRAYYSQAPWKRIVVILAGPGVNILIAFVLFWAVLLSGSLNGATALGNLDPSLTTTVDDDRRAAVEPGEPADGVLRPATGSSPSTAGRDRWARRAQDQRAPLRGSAGEGCARPRRCR